MAYEIRFTDFVNKGSLTVETNSVNSETSLQLPGRALTDYGRLVGENFLHLLENFANNNPPANPVEGQLWYDNSTSVDQLKIYDGTQWVSASGVKKATATPDNRASSVGDLWVNTTTQQLFLFNGSRWILVGPEFNSGTNSGSRFVSLLDINDNTRSVIINYINNTPVLIISTEEFTPKVAIAGFPVIRAGVSIATGYKFYGISEKAESLIIPGETNPVPASRFARLDRQNRFDEAMRIAKNDGLRIGETSTLSLAISGSNSVISNLIPQGNIVFRINNGTLREALVVRPSAEGTLSGLGINKSPTCALDVTGSAALTQNLTVGNSLTVTNDSTLTGNVTVGNSLSVSGNITTSGNLTVNSVIPNTNGTANIGSSDNEFAIIYAQTLRGNADTADIAGSANSLAVEQPFDFNGDLEIPVGEPLPTFDGSSPVTFNVRVKSSFVSDKPSIDAIETDDELLINRSGNLLKIKQEDLVKKIPTTGVVGPIVPIGTILPFAGITAPTGWFICDGATKNRDVYQDLFDVIGYSYGQDGTNFRLPDFRGRFLLGALLGASTNLNTRVITNSETLGLTGGAESRTLSENNLPEHDHIFKDNLGSQYYAVSPTTLPGDETIEMPFSGNSPGAGVPLRGLTGAYKSDTPATPESFSITNPYATVNYIIYYGIEV